MIEKEIELSLEIWRHLLEQPPYGTPMPKNYAFWTMAMPEQYERPAYYKQIYDWYSKGEFDPLGYVDGYHPLITGSTAFNFFIQDQLIKEARYVVGDISVVRHNSLFEVGFGMGIGAQVRLYCDIDNPIRSLYKPEEGVFNTSEEIRNHLPPQLRDTEVASVPKDNVFINKSGHHATKGRKLKGFIREYVHKPLLSRIRRRSCLKNHLADVPCEFNALFNQLESGRYFYQISRQDHKVQADFISHYLKGRGLTDVVTAMSGSVKDSLPLCKSCFALQLAECVVADATASPNYMVDAAECAFILGMAVGFSRTRKKKRILPFYQEPMGPFAMFAGGRAGWWWESWQTNIGEQLDGWFGIR